MKNIFLCYIHSHIKSQTAYVLDFAFQLIADIIWGIVGIVMLLGIFTNIPVLKGYSFWSVMLIYGFSMFSVGVYYVFFKNIERLHSTYILDGELEKILIRPIDPFLGVILDRFNFEKGGDLIAAITIIPISLYKLGVKVSLVNLAALLVFLLSSTVIYVSIMLIFASLSFWIEDRNGFLDPISTLRIYGKYPMDIYAPMIKVILTWILPFGFTAFYPALYFIDTIGDITWMSYLTPVVAMIFLIISRTVFRFGLDRYEGVGN